MIGITYGTKSTKLTLHELGGNGRMPTVTKVSTPGSSTLRVRDVPMPLVKNLMALHESAAPGSVKSFAKNVFKVGLMDEFLTDAIEPYSALTVKDKKLDMKNPERLMEAFYAASFLQNEEAQECLVYSSAGRVVGMAQIGQFAPKIDGLSCTISNLMISPKLDACSQAAVIRHVAETAQTQMGEASLLTPEPWGTAYISHGFTIETPAGSAAEKDPVGTAIIRATGSAKEKANVVRCKWEGAC